MRHEIRQVDERGRNSLSAEYRVSFRACSKTAETYDAWSRIRLGIALRILLANISLANISSRARAPRAQRAPHGALRGAPRGALRARGERGILREAVRDDVCGIPPERCSLRVSGS